MSIAEGNGKQCLEDGNRFFEIALGSALECAVIHDVLFRSMRSIQNRIGLAGVT
ncbi:MAG: hypothetical protein ACK5PZ_10940 [Pirellula sp.]